ncbi:MAG: response regulator transcription factor [Polyangiaceae bacterium]|nr:response regulator transcription factor [Polyangiaceae bacterium]
MSQMQLLIAEDHPEMLEFYARVLRSDGHDVSTCLDGGAALDSLQRKRFDLVVLDLRMPVVDGFSVCRTMRAAGDRTPVLALTGLTSDAAQLEAFEAGADDFVMKPCSLDVLLARVRAILRRTAPQGTMRLGRWCVDRDSSTAFAPGDRTEPIRVFTSIEMRVLWLLLERTGALVSRDEIMTTCWTGREVSDNALSAVAVRLRQKLKGSGMTISTARGKGLAVEPEEENL